MFFFVYICFFFIFAICFFFFFFFFSSRRRHTRCGRDWSSDVCSSDLWVVSFVVRCWSYVCRRQLSANPSGLWAGRNPGIPAGSGHSGLRLHSGTGPPVHGGNVPSRCSLHAIVPESPLLPGPWPAGLRPGPDC